MNRKFINAFKNSLINITNKKKQSNYNMEVFFFFIINDFYQIADVEHKFSSIEKLISTYKYISQLCHKIRNQFKIA